MSKSKPDDLLNVADVREALGDKITSGVTYAELADKIGTNPGNLNSFRTGRRGMNGLILLRLLNILGLVRKYDKRK